MEYSRLFAPFHKRRQEPRAYYVFIHAFVASRRVDWLVTTAICENGPIRYLVCTGVNVHEHAAVARCLQCVFYN
jgi:hypothetical protein